MQWPAQMYNNQKNPQVTGKNGYFAFFTPSGSYYLQVDDITGYQSWRSPVVQVITQIVHVNIPFTPLPATAGYTVTTTPRGQVMPAVITVPVGSSIAWLSDLIATTSVTEVAQYHADPAVHPRTGGALNRAQQHTGL